jgi:hypothetical protein
MLQNFRGDAKNCQITLSAGAESSDRGHSKYVCVRVCVRACVHVCVRALASVYAVDGVRDRQSVRFLHCH